MLTFLLEKGKKWSNDNYIVSIEVNRHRPVQSAGLWVILRN